MENNGVNEKKKRVDNVKRYFVIFADNKLSYVYGDENLKGVLKGYLTEVKSLGAMKAYEAGFNAAMALLKPTTPAA